MKKRKNRQSEKVCKFCSKEFLGEKNSNYCSAECESVSREIRRFIRCLKK